MRLILCVHFSGCGVFVNIILSTKPLFPQCLFSAKIIIFVDNLLNKTFYDYSNNITGIRQHSLDCLIDYFYNVKEHIS